MLVLLIRIFEPVIAGFILLIFGDFISDFLPNDDFKRTIVLYIILFILWAILDFLIVKFLC